MARRGLLPRNVNNRIVGAKRGRARARVLKLSWYVAPVQPDAHQRRGVNHPLRYQCEKRGDGGPLRMMLYFIPIALRRLNPRALRIGPCVRTHACLYTRATRIHTRNSWCRSQGILPQLRKGTSTPVQYYEYEYCGELT